MKKKKILLIIIPVIMICLVTWGITYAFYTASNSVEDKIVGVAASPDISVEVEEVTQRNSILIPIAENLLGTAISHNPKCIDDNNNEVCDIYKITVTSNSEAALYISGELNLVGSTLPNLKWKEIASDSTLKEGAIVNGLGTNRIFHNDILPIGGSKEYYVVVYINEINDTQNDTGTFSGTVTVNGMTAMFPEGNNINMINTNAVQYITNLYNGSAKTVVTNNSINYNYAPSANLMNDRLGSMGTSIDGGNIRYFGASPNNYIDIGDGVEQVGKWEELNLPFSSASECEYMATNYEAIIGEECSNYSSLEFEDEASCRSTFEEKLADLLDYAGASNMNEFANTYCVTELKPKLWRIIGVFDGKLKIIRDRSIRYYSWDNKNTSTGAEDDWGKNDWTTARLMKLLNPSDYYTTDSNDNGYGQSLYWNQESGKCFYDKNNATKDCDFTNSGLSNVAKSRVAEVTWNLGGWNTSEIYSNQIYNYERGTATYNNSRPTTWTGKVGLMYLSDYGYATDFRTCNSNLYDYDTDGCHNSDWLIDPVYYQFFLTVNPKYTGAVCMGGPDGGIECGGTVATTLPIRPVLYLTPNQVILSGLGTEDDPYILA